MGNRRIIAATVNMDCILGNRGANVEKVIKAVQAAKRMDANIIAFPELAVTGYALSAERFRELAEPIPGPTVSKLEVASKENDIYIAIGMAERTLGKVYNAGVLISPNGLVGKCRKMHLFKWEKKLFQPGEEIKVFRTDIGTFGIAICYDFEFPEYTRTLALKGANVILYLSAEMSPYEEQHDTYVKARALENCVFIVGSNRVGKEDSHHFFGRSQIIAPDGEVLSRISDHESMAFATLNMDRLAKAKALNPYLSDRKPRKYTIL